MKDYSRSTSKGKNEIPFSFKFVCILSVLLEETFIAFFPVMVIIVMCFITSGSYPLPSIYNNLFVGFSTISAGNIIYISSKKKIQQNKESHKVLTIMNFFSFSVALICCCCYSNADMGYIKILPNMNIKAIMFIILVFIVPVEIQKIQDRVNERGEIDQ